ncbi:hypothetical protein ACOSP7_022239 [Xanthoceras sorbifolium]
MKSLADNLTAAGQVTIDQDVVMSVLNGLGLECDLVIVHITSRQDVIPLSEAQYLLMTQEKRMEQYHSSALVNLSNIAAHFASNDKRSHKGGNNSGRSGNNRCGRGKGYNRIADYSNWYFDSGETKYVTLDITNLSSKQDYRGKDKLAALLSSCSPAKWYA